MLALSPDRRLDWSRRWPVGALVLLCGLGIGALATLTSPAVVLAGVAGLAVTLAVLRQPVVGLHILVLQVYLLPFAVIPLQVGVRLTTFEALLGLTWISLIAVAARARSRAPIRPTLLLFGALLFTYLLAFLLSQPYSASAEVSRQFAKLLLGMAVFPLTLALVTRPASVDRLLLTLCAAAAVEGALATLLYALPRETSVELLGTLGPLGYPTGDAVLRFLPGENDTYTDILRATGTSIDPNALAGGLMIGATVMLVSAFSPRAPLPRWLLIGGAALAVSGMLLSHSRASWVGLAVCLLALATLRQRRLWLAIAPAALLIALTPLGRTLYGRVLSGFAGQDKAAGMRLDEYRNAIEIVRQHPLFGIGFGAPPTIDLAPGVSSLYLTIAESAGLITLVVFLVLVGHILLGGLHGLLQRGADTARDARLSVLIGAVVAALVAGLFDHYFASTAFPHLVALFWLTLALLHRALEARPPAMTGCGPEPLLPASRDPASPTTAETEASRRAGMILP